MARQKSIFTLVGSIGDVTFYKTKDGFLAKQKGGNSREKIKTDPRFERTRENNQEFKEAAEAGKLLRNAIRVLIKNAWDTWVTSRLAGLLTKVLKEDMSSRRGERKIANGLNSSNGKALLKNFNFNKNSIQNSILQKPIFINTTDGSITIDNLISERDLKFPIGASHFNLSGGILMIDFNTKTYDLKLMDAYNGPINNTLQEISITTQTLPAGNGIKLYFLKIEFLQLINGIQYAYGDGFYNSLAIVEID